MAEDEPPRILDPTTEAFHEVWAASRADAEAAAAHDERDIASRVEARVVRELLPRADVHLRYHGGRMALPEVTGEIAYEWFTELMRETERCLAQRLSRYTTDLLLLICRRDEACRILHEPVRASGERVGAFGQIEVILLDAIRRFAAPGTAPVEGGEYRLPVSRPLAIDISAARRLCELYEHCRIQRRRLLIQGVLSVGAEPFPRVELPDDVERRLSIHTSKLEARGTGVLSRAGLHVRPVNLDRDGVAPDAYWFYFVVAMRWRPTPPEHPPHLEHASDVRPFAVAYYDARHLLKAIELFGPAMISQWQLSPVEMLAAVVVTSMYWRNRLLDPKNLEVPYLMETRAMMSIDAAELTDYLSRGLPVVAGKFGTRLSDTDVPRVVRAFLDRFAAADPRTRPAVSKGQGPSLMSSPVPFLFRVGDRLLADFAGLLRAISSNISALDFRTLQVQRKGVRFEDDVRRLLLSELSLVRAAPEIERTLMDADRTVGDVDVAVQAGDAVFIIECKSRRTRGTDDCVSFREAVARKRKILEWAAQARRTARYLADRPGQGNQRLPQGTKWIVPIVCSPIIEAVWQDDADAFLVPGEVPIVMTPEEIVDFIQSDRWRTATDTAAYAVAH